MVMDVGGGHGDASVRWVAEHVAGASPKRARHDAPLRGWIAAMRAGAPGVGRSLERLYLYGPVVGGESCHLVGELADCLLG